MNELVTLIRKPDEYDIDRMYEILEESLSPFLSVNSDPTNKNKLSIDRASVKDYLRNPPFSCIVAETNSHISGWIAGSSDPAVLSEHSCTGGEFYIEEIVVDANFRGKGIGRILLDSLPLDGLKNIIVDTPLINTNAVAFYEKMGFIRVQGLPQDFSRNWIRLSKKIV